jgi:hypothetical protein
MKTNFEVLGSFGPVEVRVEDGYKVAIYERGETYDDGTRSRAKRIEVPLSDLRHLIMLLSMAKMRDERGELTSLRSYGSR